MAKKKAGQTEVKAEDLSNREKALLLKQRFNKELKKNLLQMYTEDDDLSVERLSSGIPSLDLILGQGNNGYGWGIGRINCIHGPEGTGKTSLVLSTIKEAQKHGVVVLIESEGVYDPGYAKTVGVDIDEILVIQPDSTEEAFDAAESLANTGDVSLIVIDSLDGLTPKAIMEATAEDSHVGVAARLNNKFLNKMTSILRKHGCTLLIVSQLREKIGGYGNPEVVGGGRGLKFYASTRLEIRRGDELDKNGNKYGHIVKAKTIKNKLASPQQVAHFKLLWGKGFDESFCLFNAGVRLDIISKSGSWFEFNGRTIQGEEKFCEALNTDVEFRNKLKEKILCTE